MADIFISWGAPDARVVRTLRDRLRSIGLSLFEYEEDMPAGAPIHQQVLEEIRQAELAIVCVSDVTAERPWVVRETDWCYGALTDPAKNLKQIMPVWVGPHPENKLPSLIKELSLAAIDVSNESEAAFDRVVRDVSRYFGQKGPIVLPIAMFAMTKVECEKFFFETPLDNKLNNLCAAVGMKTPPDLKALLDRYGDKPTDFSPFQAKHRLVDSIYAVLSRVNGLRSAEGRRPIYLRWMQEELYGVARQDARNLWSAGDSLLIVDSVSAFHPKIKTDIMDLPESVDRARQAVLWVPPYTHHTADLEGFLLTAAQVVGRLGDALAQWHQQPHRLIAFDAATALAMTLWLHRAFIGVPDELLPLPGNISFIRPAGSNVLTTKSFWHSSRE